MDGTLYLAFVVATAVLILLPGPSIMLTVAHSLAYGWRRALTTVAGITLGGAVQIGVATAGMASLALFLAEWFELLRWLGVAYLVWLGARQWRAPVGPPQAGTARSGRSLFLQGLVVTIFNPKSMLFLIAFLPQFVDPAAAPAPQLALLGATFLVIVFVFTAAWGLAAGAARHWFASPRAERLRNRLTGGLMAGAGAGLALTRTG